MSLLYSVFYQRWSRGHKARGQGQGHKKNPRPRPRTAFPRTDTLEAKDRNARGQGQGPRTQSASALQKKKKKKKKVFTKFFKRSPRKNAFQKIFQPLHKILTFQKIVLSSSRGQANFRGLEASRPRPRTWPSRPRPRTSKSVLEDVLEAKDVLEDSTSVFYCQHSRSLKGLALFTLHSMQAMRVFLLSNILGLCIILDQYLALKRYPQCYSTITVLTKLSFCRPKVKYAQSF